VTAQQHSAAAALLPLLIELNDLKRIRVADRVPSGCGSLATRVFRRAWHRIMRGDDLSTVALNETAHAVAAARLAGIDARVLQDGGFDSDQVQTVLERGFNTVAGGIETQHRDRLRAAISAEPVDNPNPNDLPAFVELLVRQPRAGATRPDHPRVVLEPTENHAEHCALVAINAVLFAPFYEADPGRAFLSGLAHHFHNAYLPDAGYAGDTLLGGDLQPLMERFRQRSLEELPAMLHDTVRGAIGDAQHADNGEAKAFQAADVTDRVLEMRWHAQSAAFTLDVALKEMDIVHPGNVQLFQQALLRDMGIM
jgi:hypothetical protein